MSAGYHGKCALRDGVPSQADSDFGEQSGIYSLSSRNVIVGNRISGMDNALFINQQGGFVYGKDLAGGKVATTAAPFARTQFNVFHTVRPANPEFCGPANLNACCSECFEQNSGFGWYVNGHMPLRVDIDEAGHVVDWASAVPFDPSTGEDQAVPFVCRDHVEYLNDFSFGACT